MNIIKLLLLATLLIPNTAYNRGFDCLALAVYYEARGETVEGQLYVARTVLNRVASPRYPNTVCGVVYQKHQFSWTKHKQKLDFKQYQRVVYNLNNNTLPEHQATHFYHKSVRVRKLKLNKQVGNHKFYREI